MKKFFSAVLTAAIMLGSFYFGCGHCSAQEDTSRIPIAMALDNNFALPTIVTMTSLLENKSDTTEYEFYMLLSGDFLDSNKQKLTSLTERYNCKINLIDMADHYSNDRTDGHLTTAMYYRLQLPWLLEKESKCLYLDGDTIVTGDLSEMYNVDMEDYYLAGVKDWAICAKGKRHADFLGISTMDGYINSGVLVMNLQKMREDNLMQKFDDFMPIINNAGNRQVHHDQDILNAVCFGKIYHFPCKCNAITGKTDFALKHYDSEPVIRKCFTREEWIEAANNPLIIHYTWKKPWYLLDKKFADKWWQYAYKSGFINEIKEKYQPDYKGIPFINESFESDEITTIPIAMATDKNYVLPTVVTMTSMLENAHPSTRYEFYILLSGDLEEKSRQRLLSVSENYNNCSVSLIDMKDRFSHVYTSRHITEATYYRLVLPSLLPNINKIIYLDVDMIIRRDLSNLFSTDIGGCYIAGVKNPHRLLCADPHLDYAKFLNVSSLNQYVNAGMLVMNLDKMRKDSLEEEFFKFIEANKVIPSHDQDVLNSVCFSKIYHLPCRYNFMMHYEPKSIKNFGSDKWLRECYDKEDYVSAYENPTIIHYSANKKPWKKGCTGISRAREWWEYANKTPYYEEILANSKKDKKENQPIVEARAEKTSDKTSTKIPPQESSVQQTRKIPQKYKRFVFRKVLQH